MNALGWLLAGLGALVGMALAAAAGAYAVFAWAVVQDVDEDRFE